MGEAKRRGTKQERIIKAINAKKLLRQVQYGILCKAFNKNKQLAAKNWAIAKHYDRTSWRHLKNNQDTI